MIQWHKNLDLVSHTEASSEVWDGLASNCSFTGQRHPVGPAFHLTPQAWEWLSISNYIWATDIIIKSICTGSCSSRTKATFKFAFHRRRKKIRLTQGPSFLSFFFISGRQTKKINDSRGSNWHFYVKWKWALIPIQIAALGDRLIILEF